MVNLVCVVNNDTNQIVFKIFIYDVEMKAELKASMKELLFEPRVELFDLSIHAIEPLLHRLRSVLNLGPLMSVILPIR
jgi:hypothetical protein